MNEWTNKSVVGAGKNDTDEINEHSDLSDDHGLNLEIPELRGSAPAISDPSL